MSSEIVIKNKKELGEDELIKSQSLEQFREYITKHPYLSHVPQSKNQNL